MQIHKLFSPGFETIPRLNSSENVLEWLFK
jgi:hypothetical protein